MNPQVQLDNAMQCAQRGEFPSAITALSEMIEAMPNEGILFQALGSVLLQADKAQDAVPVLQHAASLCWATLWTYWNSWGLPWLGLDRAWRRSLCSTR